MSTAKHYRKRSLSPAHLSLAALITLAWGGDAFAQGTAAPDAAPPPQDGTGAETRPAEAPPPEKSGEEQTAPEDSPNEQPPPEGSSEGQPTGAPEKEAEASSAPAPEAVPQEEAAPKTLVPFEDHGPDTYDQSASDISALEDVSLLKLIDGDVAVASTSKSMTSRTAPGIVTVITADEIEKLGARDLMDVLRTVPGFDVESDISGALGLGVRGNWVAEGKVLVLIDGVQVNDDYYGSTSWGHHYPVELIEKLEIIRGPGSAMYGGAAEFGVISIITKKKIDDGHGAEVTGHYGTMPQAMERAGGSGWMGGSGKNWSYRFGGSYTKGNLSDKDATDLWGETYDMGEDENSARQSVFFTGGGTIGDLRLDFFGDAYQFSSAYPSEYYDPATSEGQLLDYKTQISALGGAVAYDIHASDAVTITPRFQLRSGSPWEESTSYGNGEPYYDFHVRTMRYTGELTGSWDITKKLNVVAGGAYERVSATDVDEIGEFGDGVDTLSFNQGALHIQGLAETDIANFTLGARADFHERFNTAFSPRFAATKVFAENYHVKLLASRAFKAPTLGNLNFEPDIQPEKTTVLEAEIGAAISDVAFVALNGFYNHLTNGIVYTYDIDTLTSSYGNYGSTDTVGGEITAKAYSRYVDANASYSLMVVTHNDVETYAVPNHDYAALALPNQKGTAALTFKAWRELSFTPSAVVIGERWGITTTDPNTFEYIWTKEPVSVLVNFNALYRDAFEVAGLSLSASVHNLLNDKFRYIEAYQGDDQAMPGPSTTFFFRAGYEL